MTPDAPDATPRSDGAFSLVTLTRRADFLRAARGRRTAMPGFILQAYRRAEAPQGPIRIGYTCSRKVGNAVARNRAKRRLRALARDIITMDGRPGWDYVLVGRAETTSALPYAALRTDLQRALTKVHR